MQTLLGTNNETYSCKSVECNLFLRTQVLESVWSFSTYESVGSLRSTNWMEMKNTINALGRGIGLKQCQVTPMNGLCEKGQFHLIFLWSPSTQWKYWREIRWLRHPYLLQNSSPRLGEKFKASYLSPLVWGLIGSTLLWPIRQEAGKGESIG